jgi:cation:H+ antiporter
MTISPTERPNSHFKDGFLLTTALVLCGQWLVLKFLGWNLPAPWQPILPGLAIFGAAFLLSWAAELAQMEIPQALALAFVALVAVLPEYAVDMYFAWTAGKNPAYVAYAAANMTGGNRLLIGAGWTVVVFAYWFKSRKKEIVIDTGHRLELWALIAATLYSFALPLKRSISWVDSVILVSLFGIYMTYAARSGVSEHELEDGTAAWMAENPRLVRCLLAVGLFLLAGAGIFMAAHPFAEGLLESGRHWGVEEFLLVQWLAPLASESPEFLVAILFAIRNRPGAGIGTLLSSTVNQWTLLVGMLPLAYSLSSGHLQAMHLDNRQVEELLLTSAQSLFATLILCDMRFSLRDGIAILVLFLLQFLLVSPTARYIYSGVYLVVAVCLFAFNKSYRQGFFAAFRQVLSRPTLE